MAKKFLDNNGLSYLWSKIKGLLGNKVDKSDVSDFIDKTVLLSDETGNEDNSTVPTSLAAQVIANNQIDEYTENVINPEIEKKLDKTTYEYNKEIVLNSDGVLYIGQISTYMRNITIDVSHTYAQRNLNSTFNGKIIISSWYNPGYTDPLSYKVDVYGDPTGYLSSALIIKQEDSHFHIYLNLSGTSLTQLVRTLFIHIQAKGGSEEPKILMEYTKSIPTTNLLTVNNVLRNEIPQIENGSFIVGNEIVYNLDVLNVVNFTIEVSKITSESNMTIEIYYYYEDDDNEYVINEMPCELGLRLEKIGDGIMTLREPDSFEHFMAIPCTNENDKPLQEIGFFVSDQDGNSSSNVKLNYRMEY